MGLSNPPVVEVGIDFHFDPDPEKQPWDLPVAMPFIDGFKESFPHVEIVKTEEIRIEKRTAQGIPERLSGKIRLDQVKASAEEEQERIEVGNDRMAYRLLRCGTNYPGFDPLLEGALEKLTQYVEHFHPVAVRHATLTYVDIVRIPVAPGESVELDDYFHLGINLPNDPFGPLGGFVFQFMLQANSRADELRLVFATEPCSESGVLRFQMRWQSLCDKINSLDKETLSQRLRAAHEHLRKCFFASFTPRGLELFDPTGAD